MKKILLSILTFLGIGVSFCSAEVLTFTNAYRSIYNVSIDFNDTFSYYTLGLDGYYDGNVLYGESTVNGSTWLYNNYFYFSNDTPSGPAANYLVPINNGKSVTIITDSTNYPLHFGEFSLIFGDAGGGSCPDALIDVQYNSGNTSTITCDGINYISIDGLSTLTNSNVNYEYTPYMNIDYKDEDNQSLVESYDKSILYLSGSLFKKTYTDNNDWILTVQGGNSDNSFSGYLPTFEITGTIEDVSTSGNIFNNFAENSVKFTLSNIPSYIQYVIIIMLLFFVLGIIRKFKRR